MVLETVQKASISIQVKIPDLEMSLVASKARILTPLFCLLWESVNNSKSYVQALPMILSFKVVKYFSSGK